MTQLTHNRSSAINPTCKCSSLCVFWPGPSRSGCADGNMMIIGEAYTPDVFAKAQALLQKARAACELDADIARIDFLGLGLRHGMLTHAAYSATLNQTSCTSADGDVTVGFNQSATCDVRAAVPAARELREYRIQI
eukprot:COSAG04_NODE_3381_length_2872_cov_1.843130_1_plen_135_part_10